MSRSCFSYRFMDAFEIAARGFGAERHGRVEEGVYLRLAASAAGHSESPDGISSREAQFTVSQAPVELIVVG